MSLNGTLGAALNEPLSSVEILPGEGKEWLAASNNNSGTHFLLVEGNLGVPQKVLYRAYLEASRAFGLAYPLIRNEEETQSHVLDEISQASAILLLANPGHQTAWNSRKQLLQSGVLGLDRELQFTRALLRVRDCAKHSLLWHHRRWVLRKLYPLRADEKISEGLGGILISDEDSLIHLDMPSVVIRAEFAACTLASETYERNYFAWAHRFRCLEALIAHYQIALNSSNSIRANELGQLLHEELAEVSLWIERHVSDYTAAQYHCRAATIVTTLRTWRNAQEAKESRPARGESVAWRVDDHPLYVHAKSLVSAYPDHESLWMYLRGAIWAIRGDRGTIDDAVDFAQQWVPSPDSLPLSAPLPGTKLSKVSCQNAIQFLAWWLRFMRQPKLSTHLTPRAVQFGKPEDVIRQLNYGFT